MENQDAFQTKAAATKRFEFSILNYQLSIAEGVHYELFQRFAILASSEK